MKEIFWETLRHRDDPGQDKKAAARGLSLHTCMGGGAMNQEQRARDTVVQGSTPTGRHRPDRHRQWEGAELGLGITEDTRSPSLSPLQEGGKPTCLQDSVANCSGRCLSLTGSFDFQGCGHSYEHCAGGRCRHGLCTLGRKRKEPC